MMSLLAYKPFYHLELKMTGNLKMELICSTNMIIFAVHTNGASNKFYFEIKRLLRIPA